MSGAGASASSGGRRRQRRHLQRRFLILDAIGNLIGSGGLERLAVAGSQAILQEVRHVLSGRDHDAQVAVRAFVLVVLL